MSQEMNQDPNHNSGQVKTTLRTKRGLREYSYLGCPLTRNRSPWCFRLCVPEESGEGFCGRLAPHGMQSRIQRGIAERNQRLQEAHFEKLEKMYLAAPCNDYYEPGIKIAEGTAEIVIPVREEFFHAAGAVHGSVYFKALDDAAFFAVNSVVQDVFVLTTNLNTYLSRPISAGLMVARGRLVSHSGKQFLAESVLTSAEGKEIGRAHGTFVRSKMKLSADLGYG
jgi:uncharacterized protein (TIGR00369 family)